MSSLVAKFQSDIISGSRNETELLRTAKLIAAKLQLPSVEEWIEHELNGYPEEASIPEYRIIIGDLFFRHPYHGWQQVVGFKSPEFKFINPISSAILFSAHGAQLPPPRNFPILDGPNGNVDQTATQFQQKIVLDATPFKNMREAVRNRLLDWAISLERAGITGTNMQFNENEKRAAKAEQTVNIQNFHGVYGSVTGATINVYDYGQIHQTLKQNCVPQDARNQLENILDELKEAKASEKPSTIERLGKWMEQWGSFVGPAGKMLEELMK